MPDDMVTVTMPRTVARALERLLGAHLLAAYRKTGGTASPDAEHTLRALRDAAQGRTSSAPGTPPAAPPTVDHGSVLGIDTAADVLGCSAEYARRLARAGRLPAHRVGTVWTIHPQDLDAYRYGRTEAPDGIAGPAREGEAERG